MEFNNNQEYSLLAIISCILGVLSILPTWIGFLLTSFVDAFRAGAFQLIFAYGCMLGPILGLLALAIGFYVYTKNRSKIALIGAILGIIGLCYILFVIALFFISPNPFIL
jgi:hypothetical protein